jgi:hypothetical protein
VDSIANKKRWLQESDEYEDEREENVAYGKYKMYTLSPRSDAIYTIITVSPAMIVSFLSVISLLHKKERT